MATTISSTLSNLLPKFIARAKLRTSEQEVFKQFVDVVQHGAAKGRVYNEPTFGRLNAYPGSEGVEVGIAQILADGNSAWTPTEHLAQIVVTKRAISVNAEPILKNGEKQLSTAMATRKDTQITALFASATGINADLGAAAAALATQDIFAAKTNVIATDDANYGYLPTDAGGQLIFACHPRSMFDVEADILSFSSSLLAATTPLGEYATEIFKDGATRNAAMAMKGTIAGCIVVESNNMTPDSSDDVANIVFGRDAFVLIESGGMDHNVDERILSGRGVEVTLSEWYVAVERTDSWAQIITADAAAVT